VIQDVFGKEMLQAIFVHRMRYLELVNGPHGYMHGFRTMLIAGKINQELGNLGDPTVILCASTFHDIGRTDDSADALHGYRGVPRILSIMDSILEPRAKTTDYLRAWDVIKGKSAAIVAHHNQPIMGLSIEAKIVMDADKLEMYRTDPQLPDPLRLALDVSRNLIQWSRELILQQGG
jgi:HD superfamily phosphodiesterase